MLKVLTTATLTGIVALALIATSCKKDNDANDAMIGAECTTANDCDDGDDATDPLVCLQDFDGGYCGDASCIASTDCPEGSSCATLDGTSTFCFLHCSNKDECNVNRTAANESNCSANVDTVENDGQKLCIPPSN